MTTDIDDLQSERAALMSRIVEEMAAERGLDLSEGLPPDTRNVLIYEAERAYEDWFARIQDGELPTPASPVEYLLAEVYALDTKLHKAIESGRGPGDTVH
jgi:hypothetical protein